MNKRNTPKGTTKSNTKAIQKTIQKAIQRAIQKAIHRSVLYYAKAELAMTKRAVDYMPNAHIMLRQFRATMEFK